MRGPRKPKWWRKFGVGVDCVTAEWLLKQVPNGGAVIAFRSAFTTLWVFVLVATVYNLGECVAGRKTWATFDAGELTLQLRWLAKLSAAIFGAVYAGLYTRFSSQWAYLAGTYNQIKRTECSKEFRHSVLAEWKAGFIEDADALHLATKPIFAATIKVWLDDRRVIAALKDYAADGREFSKEVQLRVNAAVTECVAERRLKRMKEKKLNAAAGM